MGNFHRMHKLECNVETWCSPWSHFSWKLCIIWNFIRVRCLIISQSCTLWVWRCEYPYYVATVCSSL